MDEDAFVPEAVQESQDPPEAKKKPKREAFLASTNVARIQEGVRFTSKEFTFEREDILDVPRKDYLLLGFDTEYQPNKETFETQEIAEGKAKYEVLSYQFYAINNNGVEWSGIAIPRDGQRLTFTEFIVFAIAKGVELGEIIPKTIVLVAHYNRADLPAFDDRKQLWWQLQNVRNSLISAGHPVKVRVAFSDDDGDHIDLSVYVRDTMLLAPAGQKSLAGLGKLIGREKMRLSDNDEEELLLKKSMKNLRALDWETFKEYAILDAEISAKYFQRLTQMYQAETGDTFIPSALSNIGVKLLVKEWDERSPPVAVHKMVGKDKVEELVWDEISQQFKRIKHTPYVEELSWFVDFVTETYHGGRNEQFWFGASFEDDWYDYDLTSAYPTAMALIGRADWRNVRPISSIDELVDGSFGFACVDFKFPPDTRFPTLPVRSQNGLIFPLTGRSYCAMPEIELARQLGCEMTLKHGVIVPQDPDDKVFFPFIKESIRKRVQSPTKIENSFWKEITNSCYGKTAQGLREKRVYSLRKRKGERIGESTISNPFYASYITSFVRAVVGEIMNRVPFNKMVFSVTTDGFITNATVDEMDHAKDGAISRKFAEARCALTGNPEVLSEKHRVRQLLGWRTRGQATIKPGENVDSERFVLAKAGIKAPVWTTEVVEQNSYIVDLFFKRDAVHKIELDYHTSIREMLLFDADLVSKKSKKHISMEYDFKRRPKAVGMTETSNPNPLSVPHEHVVFSTEPWQSIAEFQRVRTVWNDYYKRNKACLKTSDDFGEFASYFDMVESLSPANRVYMKKQNADLMRLRRDLCRAFKWGKAGFSEYPHVTAKEFALALTVSGFEAAGVKVSPHDVNNGLKADFVPHATPRTPAVLGVLEAIAQRFPLFDSGVIEASPGLENLRLSEALSKSCEFVERAINPGRVAV